MWIFTPKGFVSVVAHRNKPGYFMARARLRGHLDAVFPGTKAHETPSADYRFRTVISAEAFHEGMKKAIEDLDYDNFKNSIEDVDYHDMASDVWQACYRMQSEVVLNGPGGPLRRETALGTGPD
jgi:hypothetical protein